jgi:hypothetical protein
MRVLAAAALLAALAACTHADRVPAAGLCTAGETTYFACPTTKSRWISLCGTPSGSLQYRFGTPAKAELRYPSDPASGSAGFLFAHYFRFQTDRTEVTFRNQGVEYAVFDYSEDRTRRSGVRVTSAEGKDTELVCSGGITSRLPELKGVLKCDADNALNGGSCR